MVLHANRWHLWGSLTQLTPLSFLPTQKVMARRVALAVAAAVAAAVVGAGALPPIKHVVVLMQENRCVHLRGGNGEGARRSEEICECAHTDIRALRVFFGAGERAERVRTRAWHAPTCSHQRTHAPVVRALVRGAPPLSDPAPRPRF